jgi:molybdopterin-guanine dinucleotide biosynthesis protein A
MVSQEQQLELSGVVLAGGHSRRMGRNKALLELDGQTLISRVLERLALLCDELIVAANDVALYADLPARVVPDLIPGRGVLGGIHAGLSAASNERAVVVACDMPLLNLRLLRYMAVVSPGYDVVVPRVGGFYEPLHAVYSVRCVEPIAQLIAQGPRRVVDLYSRVCLRELTEADVRLFDASLSFVNVNTPQEWSEVQHLVDDGG